MPREYEIKEAFRQAMNREDNGRFTITTRDFVRALDNVNWHWSLKEANEWIETYITTFRDVSTEEGDDRKFQLFNPNGGL